MPQGYGTVKQARRPNSFGLRQDLGYVPARTAAGKSTSSGGSTGGGGVIVDGGPSGPVIASSRVQVTTVATATYTLTEDDLYNYIIFTNAAGCVVTVPDDVTGNWADVLTVTQPVFALQQGGAAGQITVQGAGGVTVNTLAIFKKKSYGPYAVLQLIETAPNVYTLFGAQEPV
jgi:hypothetical protein